jgi:hypothetical protein
MRSPEGKPWYAKAYLFFKATERTTVWNRRIMRRKASNKVHSLVFVRWFKVTGYTDPTQCEILEWASKLQSPPGTPWVTVKDIRSLKAVEMIMPKHTFTRGKYNVIETFGSGNSAVCSAPYEDCLSKITNLVL